MTQAEIRALDTEPTPGHPWWLILGLLAIAAITRFAWLEGMSWHSDMPLHYLRASELARGERLLTLYGYPTRAGGAHLPPIFHYYLALPRLLGGGVLTTVGWVLAGQLALLLLLLLPGRALLGRWGSLAAALALAASPALSSIARGLRNEVVILPFLVALIGCQLLALRRPKSSLPGWSFALSTFIGQVHLAALFFLLFSGPLTLLQMARAGGRRSLPGIALGLLLLLPFTIHEVGSGFRETRALVSGTAREEGSSQAYVRFERSEVLTKVPDGLARWFLRAGLVDLTGPKLIAAVEDGGAAPLAWGYRAFGWACLLLIAAGFVINALGAGAMGRREGRLLALATVLIWGGFVLVRVYSLAYIILLVPFALAHLASAVERLAALLAGAAPGKAWARRVALGLFVAGALSSAAFACACWERIDRLGGLPDRHYGATYRTVRGTVDWLLDNRRSLKSFPDFRYPLTMDLAFRERSAEQKRSFQIQQMYIEFWSLPLLYPVPRQSQGEVQVRDDGQPGTGAELARIGIVLISEPQPRPPR